MATPIKVGTMPTILPVEPGNIPQLLKEKRCWIGWRPGSYKPTGKFDKFPTNPQTGYKINPHDVANWLTFDEALAAHQSGRVEGIGYVLNDQHTFLVDGTEMFLTAIDLDGYADRMSEAKELWLKLGKPYVEVSPSGTGLRMLCLTPEVVHLGNIGDGREIYARKQFVTITGHGGKGILRDCSATLIQLSAAWKTEKNTKPSPQNASAGSPQLPDTLENVTAVRGCLNSISSDIEYETWRNIIWSLASTRWKCARELAHDWSKLAPDRYDASVVDSLFDSYNPAKGITLGTLLHHARQNNWTGPLPHAFTAEVTGNHETTSTGPDHRSGIVLYSAEQLKDLPVAPYRVRGLLPARGVAAIYGPPGSGKTFLSFDLAIAIARGTTEWFGFKVKQAPIVYVAMEGQGGLPKRMKAMEQHLDDALPNDLCACLSGLNLMTGGGVRALAEATIARLGKGAVVFVDTLNQASPGGDENSSETMGNIIANAQLLSSLVEGLVVLVHHSGKDTAKGLRGHSSLMAAMDAVIEVTSGPGGREWCLRKAKDDAGGHSRPFELVPYEVDTDEDGDPVSSCAVRPSLALDTPVLKAPTGKHQKAALAVVRQLCGSPTDRLDYRQTITKVAASLNVKKPSDRAKEALDALLRSRHLAMDEGGIYPV